MKLVYLDNAATTAPDKEIFFSAAEYCAENYFNPSALYREGREAKKIVETAREKIAACFRGKKIFFTSCGTEADNTAILSFARRGNAVTTSGEHAAVQKTYELIKQRGVEARFARLLEGGAVDVDDLLSKIDEKTSFCSVVHVNNETGAINDVNAIAKAAKAINPRLVFHTDAVQSFLKIPYEISSDVDLVSVSAHKIKALKGVGALAYNDGLHVAPLIVGGGQENGARSGTENVLGIKVFGDCCEKYRAEIALNHERIKRIRDLFVAALDERYIKVISSGDCSPYVLSLSAPKLRGEVIQTIMDDSSIIIGKGSACSSKAPFSRVLKEFIDDKDVLNGAIRISFIFDTEEADALFAADTLNKTVKNLYERIVK